MSRPALSARSIEAMGRSMKPSSEPPKAVVLGTGPAAIAAALVLARLRGIRPTILECGPEPVEFGSKLRPWHLDAGEGITWTGRPLGAHAPLVRLAHWLVDGTHAWTDAETGGDRLVYPDLKVDLPLDPRAAGQHLRDVFPLAGRTIRRCETHLRRAAAWISLRHLHEALPSLWNTAARRGIELHARLAHRTVAEWLAAEVSDPRLHSVLGARWVLSGLPPAQIPLSWHSLLWQARAERGPQGGTQGWTSSALRTLENLGSRRLSPERVLRIRHEEGRVKAVEAQFEGQRVTLPASVILSSWEPPDIARMLGDEKPIEISASSPPASRAVVLGLDMDREPAALGVRARRLWIHRQYSHASLWRQRGSVLEGHPQLIMVDFETQPGASGRHPVRIVAPVDEPERPPVRLAESTDRIQRGLLNAVASEVPGFLEAIGGAARSSRPGPLAIQPLTPPFVPGQAPSRPRLAVAGLALARACLPGWSGALLGALASVRALPDGPSPREVFRSAEEGTRASGQV